MRQKQNTECLIDPIDHDILKLLQKDCRMSLAAMGAKVGLSAPSVLERVKKLESAGIVKRYEAVLDAQRLGLDITAFIGITISNPSSTTSFMDQVAALPSVQESHLVTGSYSVLLKVKVRNTQALGEVINRINLMEGVARTESTIALSTHTERATLEIPRASGPVDARSLRARRRSDESRDQTEDAFEEIPGKD